MHVYYCRLVKLSSDRFLQKMYQTDKKPFLKGNKSWLTNIRHIEKLLNVKKWRDVVKMGLSR